MRWRDRLKLFKETPEEELLEAQRKCRINIVKQKTVKSEDGNISFVSLFKMVSCRSGLCPNTAGVETRR